VSRGRTTPVPLLDLTLVTTRAFVFPAASLVLYFTATFILIILLPFYFEGVMGYTPTQVGLIAFVMPIAMMASAPVCGWIYDKYCPKNYTAFGVLGVGLSFFLCGYGYATVNIWLVILALAFAGICRSVYQGPNTIEIMVSLPKEKAGIASSLLTILQDLGIMFGISAAAILLVLQLDALGYTGAVLSAGPDVLPPLFGNAMYAGGLICLASAAFSFRRDRPKP